MQTNILVDTRILLNLDLEELKKLCETNTGLRSICCSSEFWREKYEKEELLFLKPQLSFVEYVLDYRKCRAIQKLVEIYLQQTQHQHRDWSEDQDGYYALSVEISDEKDLVAVGFDGSLCRRMINQYRTASIERKYRMLAKASISERYRLSTYCRSNLDLSLSWSHEKQTYRGLILLPENQNGLEIVKYYSKSLTPLEIRVLLFRSLYRGSHVECQARIKTTQIPDNAIPFE